MTNVQLTRKRLRLNVITPSIIKQNIIVCIVDSKSLDNLSRPKNILLIQTYAHTHLHTYKIYDKDRINARERVDHSKLNKEILYHFAIFALIIDILIKKN